MTAPNPIGKRARRLAAKDAAANGSAAVRSDAARGDGSDGPGRAGAVPHLAPDPFAGPSLTAVTTTAGVDELARGLYDERRLQPWVVVTTPFETDDPRHDVHTLVTAVRAVARVFTIETGDLTRRLSNVLPPRLDVFGGAGRSYPVGFSPTTTLTESKLRFPSTAVRRGTERLSPDAHATERLAADALAHAYAAGLFTETPTASIDASGTVTAVMNDRAIVTLDDGGLAAIAAELTYPPTPLGWVVARGQRVTGTLDRDARRLGVELPTPTDAELATRFPHGSVTLALVLETDAHTAALALHPRLRRTVRTRDISRNPIDRADGLLSPGDVVAARILHLAAGTLHLSLWDVDDDEPIVPPLALTDGGPSWLAEGRTVPSAADVAEHDGLEPLSMQSELGPEFPEGALVEGALVDESPNGPQSAVSAELVAPSADPAQPLDERHSHAVPGPGPQPAGETMPTGPLLPPAKRSDLVESLKSTIATRDARIHELERRLAAADAPSSQLARMSGDIQRLELAKAELADKSSTAQHARERLAEQLRSAQAQLRAARRSASATDTTTRTDRRARWHDDESWLRNEVHAAWVERMPASDKLSHPLPENARWRFGPEFAASLVKLDDGQFDKVIRRLVDIATGTAGSVPTWDEHALRTGDGAGDAPVVRDDGARCMRVEVEKNTPSARRLHYWRFPGGGVEFSRVVTHDDMQP